MHFPILHAHAAGIVLRHGDGGNAQAKVRNTRPVGNIVLAFEALARIARHLVAMEARRREHVGRHRHHERLFVLVNIVNLAGVNHAAKRSVVFDGKRVHAHMRHAQVDRGLHVGFEHFGRLARNAAHKVDRYVFEALACIEHRLLGAGRIVNAIERFQQTVVEALHANGKAIHAQGVDIANELGSERIGIRLHGAFDLGRQIHGNAQSIEQFRKARLAHKARRASAQIDGFDFCELALFCLAAKLEDQIVDIFVDFHRIGSNGSRGEIAICAAMLAKRQMDIKRLIRIVRHRCLLIRCDHGKKRAKGVHGFNAKQNKQNQGRDNRHDNCRLRLARHFASHGGLLAERIVKPRALVARMNRRRGLRLVAKRVFQEVVFFVVLSHKHLQASSAVKTKPKERPKPARTGKSRRSNQKAPDWTNANERRSERATRRETARMSLAAMRAAQAARCGSERHAASGLTRGRAIRQPSKSP